MGRQEVGSRVTGYLRVAVLRLLVVQQQQHPASGIEADIDLQTRVAGAPPALGPAAVRAVDQPDHGGVEDGAADLVRPHTAEQERDRVSSKKKKKLYFYLFIY